MARRRGARFLALLYLVAFLLQTVSNCVDWLSGRSVSNWATLMTVFLAVGVVWFAKQAN